MDYGIKGRPARVVEEFGGLEILVNNADGPPSGNFAERGRNAIRSRRRSHVPVLSCE